MKNEMRSGAIAAALMLTLGAAAIHAQTPPPAPAPSTPTPTPTPNSASRPGLPPGMVGLEPGEPRSFDKVITAEAKTQEGLFRVHSLKSKLYFEIPKALLEQPQIGRAHV